MRAIKGPGLGWRAEKVGKTGAQVMFPQMEGAGGGIGIGIGSRREFQAQLELQRESAGMGCKFGV